MLATLMILCIALVGQSSSPPTPPSLLREIPATGGIPPAVDPSILQPKDGNGSAQSYEQSAKDFVRSKFGTRTGATRTEGISELARWKDPPSWQVLWDAMKREKDDVRLAYLDHLASQGGLGQAMLAKIAIRSDEKEMRHEASRRIHRPACDEVIAMLELGLRDERHAVVNQAGLLAGKVDAFAVIPTLIFAQVAADEKKTDGDLAWIAIGTRTNYIANVVPVVGDRTGAFQPIVGSLQTGVLMRVQDAMVYTYRSDVHQSLVALTTRDFGASTVDNGWDMKRWWTWFNTEYVPYKQARAGIPPAPPPTSPVSPVPQPADSSATAPESPT